MWKRAIRAENLAGEGGGHSSVQYGLTVEGSRSFKICKSIYDACYPVWQLRARLVDLEPYLERIAPTDSLLRPHDPRCLRQLQPPLQNILQPTLHSPQQMLPSTSRCTTLIHPGLHAMTLSPAPRSIDIVPKDGNTNIPVRRSSADGCSSAVQRPRVEGAAERVTEIGLRPELWGKREGRRGGLRRGRGDRGMRSEGEGWEWLSLTVGWPWCQ